MNSKLVCLAACSMLCHAAASSFATELWATTSASSPSIDLSQINIATGAVLSTKSISSGSSAATLNDFASDPLREPSVVWGVRWSAFVNQLVAVDPFQGQLLSLIQLTSPTPIKSLAIDPTDGQLYGAGGSSLFRIARTTGIATLVGTASTSLEKALAFDATGNLFGIVNGTVLATIDKSTAATSTVATTGLVLEDIAASPDNGIMYGVGSGSAYSLYQIYTSTGATTTIGPSLLRPASLAFTALPSPIGDFNGDSIVDARDYAVWRKRLGTTYTQSNYEIWRTHFGLSGGNGTALTRFAAGIPEPSSIAPLVFAVLVIVMQQDAIHHARCFTVWLAGAGVKPGIEYGTTDDFCYNIAENPVHLRDLHATMLHILGIDHKQFTYPFRGVDSKLTGVEEARDVKAILT